MTVVRRVLVIRYHPAQDAAVVACGEARVREVVRETFGAEVQFEYIELERALWERSSVRLRGAWPMSRADVLDVLAGCWLDASGAA